MNKLVTNAFIFCSGAAIGAFITWKSLSDYYKKEAQSEINSVKDYYRNKYDENIIHSSLDKSEKKNLNDAKDIAEDEGYIDYTKFFGEGTKPEDEVVTTNEPYVISPEEFGEFDDYGKIDLIYYNDGILVEDGTNEKIEDINDVIGIDSLKHFGEYEEDTVFVRNDDLKTDYEIILNSRNYAELEE